MNHLRPAHLGFVLLLLSAGCEPAAPSDTAIRTDSAGVLLVEYPDLPPIEASRISIAAEPDLVLGGGDALAGPDHEFFRIAGVSQLGDGTLVVANGSSRELRFYGEDGRHLRSVGREGGGPGEFQNLAGVWTMAGDTVIVWDGSARRLQYFSPEGALVRAASMGEAPFGGFLRPVPQAVLEDGRVAAFLSSPWRPTSGVPQRQSLLVAVQRIDGEGWDSVGVVQGNESIISPTGNGQLAGVLHTFGAYAVMAGAGTTMAVADAARFRVELFDPDGRLVSVISAAVPGVAATADVLEAHIERMIELWPGGMPHPEFPEAIRTGMRARPYAPFLPAIRALFVDGDERIWVERFDVPGSGPSRWEVFARNGTWLGRVDMPEGFARAVSAGFAPGFSIASGRLTGVWTDPDTGVETVRVYRVIELDS
ncbi:MAG: hypothetical protein ABR602_14675 [Gemmatimonadales bacterium]